MSFRVEVLSSQHDRANFSCGVAALDDWFRSRATQDQRRHVAQVFVGVENGEVLGFYSLSMSSISLDAIPEKLAKKLPRYDAIPAAIIGRLARTSAPSGKGLGRLLLADAVSRVLAASAQIAAYAIIVDAKDDAGARFYETFGFTPFPSRPRRLFLLTQTAVAALQAAGRRA